MRSKSGIRIAGSVGASTAPIRRPVENGTSKANAATEPATSAVMRTPGIAKQPEPHRHPAEHTRRELEPAVEEDERDTEREQQLGARRVERDVDRVEDGRAEQHPGREEDEHARNPQRVRHEVADEPRAEHDAEREHDVLDGHPADSAQVGGRSSGARQVVTARLGAVRSLRAHLPRARIHSRGSSC